MPRTIDVRGERTFDSRDAIARRDELNLIKPNAQWPYTCIDWERAAKELQYDYTSADLAGETYWFRG